MFESRIWQIEVQLARSILNPERFQQSEIIIERLHVSHAMLHEFVVNSRSSFRLFLDSVRHNPFSRAGKKSEKGGAIVSREIDAVIKFIPGDAEEDGGDRPSRVAQRKSIDV